MSKNKNYRQNSLMQINMFGMNIKMATEQQLICEIESRLTVNYFLDLYIHASFQLNFLVDEERCNSRKLCLMPKAWYFRRKTSANTMALRRCPPNWRANGSDNEWKPLIGPRFIIPRIEYVYVLAYKRVNGRVSVRKRENKRKREKAISPTLHPQVEIRSRQHRHYIPH